MDETTAFMTALAAVTGFLCIALLLLLLTVIDCAWRWWLKRRLLRQADRAWDAHMQARFDEFVGKR